MLSAKGFFFTWNCSETAEFNLRKVDRKQDLNVLYKVCVFRAEQKTKMWQQMWHIVLRCMICGPLGLLLFLCRGIFARKAISQKKNLPHAKISTFTVIK